MYKRQVAEVTEEKTKSGLYVPDTAKEKPQEAEVLAVGPGARDEKGERIPMDVKVGDKVIFSKYSGTEIKVDGAVSYTHLDVYKRQIIPRHGRRTKRGRIKTCKHKHGYPERRTFCLYHPPGRIIFGSPSYF